MAVQDSHLGFPAGRVQVYEFHVDWDSPTCSKFIPTQSLVPQPFNSNACHDELFCIKQPEVNHVTHLLDSLSYGYMMQRLTYRNFGPRQTLLLKSELRQSPKAIDSLAPARFDLSVAHLYRSRPRGSIREQ
jgi:hypothetical protein